MAKLIPFFVFVAVGFVAGLLVSSLNRRHQRSTTDWETKYRDLEQRYRELTHRLKDMDKKADQEKLPRRGFWVGGNGSNGD